MPRIPRWKRHVRSTPRDRASGNGSRGETPCAGAGAALAPAQGCRGSPGAAQQNRRKSTSFRAGCPASRDGNATFAQLHGIAPSPPANADSRRGTTSSVLAALGHLPLREGYTSRCGRPRRIWHTTGSPSAIIPPHTRPCSSPAGSLHGLSIFTGTSAAAA